MGEMLQTDRCLIEPLYFQSQPSEPIELGSVAVEFTHNGKIWEDVCRVRMQFTPSDRLLFLAQGREKHPLLYLDLFLNQKWDGRLKLPDRLVTLDALFLRSSDDAAGIFIPRNSVATLTPSSKKIFAVTFHIFNFPEFFGIQDYSITVGEGSRPSFKRCGRIVLSAGGWNITIAATEMTGELCEALRGQGGFVITHMGKVEREDGSTFSGEKLEHLLRCLHYFLSFALGRRTGPSLPIGFDKAGTRIFEQWGLPFTAAGPWSGSLSWFDCHHAEVLSQVFPGFLALWKSDLWMNALTKALYWYLAANERGTGIGVDAGLIPAQAALEVLAWTYCVMDRKMISERAFKPRGLSTADKFRLLASVLDIPLEIPTELPTLHAKRDKSWQDGMDAITDIRNSLVHPQKEPQLHHDVYFEAWKLSLWYLDSIFLRLFGHNGKYASRLAQRWVGQVTDVPWANIDSSGGG